MAKGESKIVIPKPIIKPKSAINNPKTLLSDDAIIINKIIEIITNQIIILFC